MGKSALIAIPEALDASWHRAIERLTSAVLTQQPSVENQRGFSPENTEPKTAYLKLRAQNRGPRRPVRLSFAALKSAAPTPRFRLDNY